jgi:hypothetical protein
MSRIAWNLFISGVLFGAGPCVASCGPILFTYIVGTGKSARSGITAYAVFSLARMVAYVSLAAGAFALGSFALEQGVARWESVITTAGGVFIFFLALLTLTAPDCSKVIKTCRGPLIERDRKSVFTLGLIAGFSPCAPLLGVLSYIAFVSKSLEASLLYGVSFGVGTCLSPLILLAGMAGLINRLGARAKETYARVLKVICALVLMALGAQLIIRGIIH